jgi:hypothetical protein
MTSYGSDFDSQAAAPWHILYFLPELHGHGELRGVLDQSLASFTMGLRTSSSGGASSE